MKSLLPRLELETAKVIIFLYLLTITYPVQLGHYHGDNGGKRFRAHEPGQPRARRGGGRGGSRWRYIPQRLRGARGQRQHLPDPSQLWHGSGPEHGGQQGLHDAFSGRES